MSAAAPPGGPGNDLPRLEVEILLGVGHIGVGHGTLPVEGVEHPVVDSIGDLATAMAIGHGTTVALLFETRSPIPGCQRFVERTREGSSRCSGATYRLTLPLPTNDIRGRSDRLGRHRWVVERSLTWLKRYRRLAVRHERLADIHQAFITPACCLVGHKHPPHDEF
jgi:hypothetical protein